jgi:hypothetical protein
VKEHEQRQNDSRHDDFADNNVDSIVLEVPAYRHRIGQHGVAF